MKNSNKDTILKNQNLENSITIQEFGFSVTRTGSKGVADPGSTVSQTITLYNTSGQTISNIYLEDTITIGAKFKENSVQIGGIAAAGVDPTGGFMINGEIPSGNSETITYDIILDNPMPESVKSVNLSSLIRYQTNEGSFTANSNIYTIEIPHGEIVIEKTSNKSAVIKGQTLMFQNVVKNTGTLQNTDVFFKDEIPVGTTFVEKSVKIDDVAFPDYNPQTGFSLGEIDGKSEKIVTFEVIIN